MNINTHIQYMSTHTPCMCSHLYTSRVHTNTINIHISSFHALHSGMSRSLLCSTLLRPSRRSSPSFYHVLHPSSRSRTRGSRSESRPKSRWIKDTASDNSSAGSPGERGQQQQQQQSESLEETLRVALSCSDKQHRHETISNHPLKTLLLKNRPLRQACNQTEKEVMFAFVKGMET